MLQENGNRTRSAQSQLHLLVVQVAKSCWKMPFCSVFEMIPRFKMLSRNANPSQE